MPQENQRSDRQRTENTAAERSSNRKPSAAIAQEQFFETLGARGVAIGLRLQREMFGVLSDIGDEWLARATSEVEWASRLPHKLTAARSVPDAVSAYQEWVGEWMNMRREDSYRFVSGSQKIINAGVRCFAEAAPEGTR
jgi:hypothetical protein